MSDTSQVMRQRMITVVLLVGLAFGIVTLAFSMSSWRFPGNEQGYAPRQPINYSHRLHAGELKIDCQFCHSSAATGRHAGIPAASVCMKCHSIVTDSFDKLQAAKKNKDQEPPLSQELGKLYTSLALDESLKPKPDGEAKPIAWVRVHNLPEYVHFDHRAHVAAGVTCQRCHGPVESMQRLRQFETLSMGWCVNCHREANEKGINGKTVHASTDCAACHY